MNVGVVNISIGNVGSVVEAFKFLRQDVTAVSEPAGLRGCDLTVLAGVGNYSTAMQKLESSGFAEELRSVVRQGKPLLGICLGMQLFADQGFEDGVNDGFGWVPGTVELIPGTTEKIPHMGWNSIVARDTRLFTGVERSSFYFMHSFHLKVSEPEHVAATVRYGTADLVAAVQSENVIGVQFHPEKSQGDGLRVLKNVLEVIR